MSQAVAEYIEPQGVWARTVPDPQWRGPGLTEPPANAGSDKSAARENWFNERKREQLKYGFDSCPFGTDFDSNYTLGVAPDWRDPANWSGLEGEPVFLTSEHIQSIGRTWREPNIKERLGKQDEWRTQRRALVDEYLKNKSIFLRVMRSFVVAFEEYALLSSTVLSIIAGYFVAPFVVGALYGDKFDGLPIWFRIVLYVIAWFFLCLSPIAMGFVIIERPFRMLFRHFPDETWPKIKILERQPTTTITYWNKTAIVVEGPPERVARGLRAAPLPPSGVLPRSDVPVVE